MTLMTMMTMVAMMMMMMLNMTGCADAKAGQCHRRDSVGQGLCASEGAGHLYQPPITRQLPGVGWNPLLQVESGH